MKEHFKVTEIGASQDQLDELQRQLGFKLPEDYVSFLRETNGAEWCVHDVGGDCLKFWETQEVLETNFSYEIQHWLPNTVAIASDGGGRAVIFDRTASTEPNQWPVFLVSFGALDRDEFTSVADNFSDWVYCEFRLPISS